MVLILQGVSTNLKLCGGTSKGRVSELAYKRRGVTVEMRCSQSRGPLWSGRILSNDSMQAVQALKRSKHNQAKLTTAIETKVSRLVRVDLLAVLKELQRQNEPLLALQVFKMVQKEIWYKPDAFLYNSIIRTLHANNIVEHIEPLFGELRKEEFLPDTRGFTQLIILFLSIGMPHLAMETYHFMKHLGCKFEEHTFRVLIKGLERHEESEAAATVQTEYEHFLESKLNPQT